MLRSMYSGISGMKNSQTKLDVIGNNIANVNTTGYKKAMVNFQDMMSQTTSGAQGATATRGGVNASQVGLGSTIGAISNIHTQGFQQVTNNPLDFAIEGDGMFVLVEGVDANGGTTNIDLDNVTTAYSRAGNFFLDDNGNIVNSQGLYLVGFVGDPPQESTINIPETAQSFSVQSNGTINYIDANGDTQVAGQVALASFSNPSGLQKAGNNLYLDSPNAGLADQLYTPESENLGSSVVSGSLEMSNVDLSEEFTEMITAQRSFQANTRIITTSDEILQELVNLKR
ncbi:MULTISPECIES: flagellar basal body rod protein FlgG [Oceanobacillus]|uniref:Flagellar hook protein FlgE n=1 Tax=Oceanobacillus kimchii TaxID=746691 RepID=A0ABQ5TIA8_9BACI|nr:MULTISPECIES: flagellar basal body rod protein FlgG [Oceanobacillus]MBT2598703.1 flagellar basal body rod protein FlgG [Oceanobacillus sp. ISL-74]MBT2651622.1 flagellar basal body rod protein FlgG [Oceanobacillus sp. ISL-73]MCT1576271.1 flagellar basal body rod protein FlgG [Oceanobacillus kimchii]MCT2135908.1 flagellar basal body rod protein FlgG [Oceanobacillus kimchii]OEH54668.1 flagellar basal-body rod protein FlgG [Oceanobacillus sp. E9]